MSYEKKFNADHVTKALAGTQGMMLKPLYTKIGCSEMTLYALLKPLIESGEVVRENIGSSEKKPTNLYRLSELKAKVPAKEETANEPEQS